MGSVSSDSMPFFDARFVAPCRKITSTQLVSNTPMFCRAHRVETIAPFPYIRSIAYFMRRIRTIGRDKQIFLCCSTPFFDLSIQKGYDIISIMKNTMHLIVTRLMQGIAGMALLLFLFWNLSSEQNRLVPLAQKAFFFLGFLLLWTATLYLDTRGIPRADNRRLRIYLLGLLLYYSWLLLHLLFFDAGFGRNLTHTGVNLTPFLTIRNYLRAYSNGNFPLRLLLINVIGNAFAFAPMGIFFPALFRKMRNFFWFSLTMLVCICAVEWIQFQTGTGSCDIDDLILNLSGAVVVWIFVQLPPIRRKLYRAAPQKGVS